MQSGTSRHLRVRVCDLTRVGSLKKLRFTNIRDKTRQGKLPIRDAGAQGQRGGGAFS